MTTTFGKILERLMRQRKITGKALARELGVPYRTVQEWIGGGGRKMPRDPDVLKEIARYFQVSVHFLLYGYEDDNNFIGEIFEKTEIHTGLYEITVKRVSSRDRKG